MNTEQKELSLRRRLDGIKLKLKPLKECHERYMEVLREEVNILEQLVEIKRSKEEVKLKGKSKR